MSHTIALDAICQRPRYREVDVNKANDIAKSMQTQGLLQPIGVKPCQCEVYEDPHYQLIFGAHRLIAAQQLQWDEIAATVFEENASDEMIKLAELEENSARNDLTGVQRKYYASEIGRLIAKMSENSDSATRNDQWLIEIAKTSNTPLRTLYDWWKAFCQEAGLTKTPRQALDHEQEQFFDWLKEQNRKAEEEKERKQAEADAKRRREDLAAILEDLRTAARDYGRQAVITEVINVFLAEDSDDELAETVAQPTLL